MFSLPFFFLDEAFLLQKTVQHMDMNIVVSAFSELQVRETEI